MPTVRREETADHAQGGGLARAVGAEETVDVPTPDSEREVAHDHLAVEGLGQPLDVDGDLAGARCSAVGPDLISRHELSLNAARRGAQQTPAVRF